MRSVLARCTATLLAMLAWTGVAMAGDTGFLDRRVVVDGVSHRYQVYVPIDYTPDKHWPIALFLHGSGERGDDGSKQSQVGMPAAIRVDRKRFPMIVVVPQARPNTRWSGVMAEQAMQALNQSIKEFNGDPQRTYLTGLSIGGQGVWLLAAAYPHRFAAIAPVCGFLRLDHDDDVSDPAWNQAVLKQFPELLAIDPEAEMVKRIGKTPAWIMHGAVDDVVPPENSRRMVAALKAVGGEVRYSEYEGVNHGSWDRAYAEPQLVPWLLSHRLGE